MKVTVSISDSLFEEAEELAKRLGATRSAFYCEALESFIRNLREDELTKCINEICANVDTSLPEDLERITTLTLERVEWDE
jgi:metal-responsive CopG/Arc/MetJ family transcriptional regulator